MKMNSDVGSVCGLFFFACFVSPKGQDAVTRVRALWMREDFGVKSCSQTHAVRAHSLSILAWKQSFYYWSFTETGMFPPNVSVVRNKEFPSEKHCQKNSQSFLAWTNVLFYHQQRRVSLSHGAISSCPNSPPATCLCTHPAGCLK